MTDQILVPRDVLAAACYAVRKVYPDSETYKRLSEYSLAPRTDTPAIPAGERDDDLEPSIALSVLDDAAKKDGCPDARRRFELNDINLIVSAMVQYGQELIAATPQGVESRSDVEAMRVVRQVGQSPAPGNEDFSAGWIAASNRIAEQLAASPPIDTVESGG